MSSLQKGSDQGFLVSRCLSIVRLLEWLIVFLCCLCIRDIYYKDPSLFRRQAVVDCYVDDLAYSFRVPRASLNVVSYSHYFQACVHPN